MSDDKPMLFIHGFGTDYVPEYAPGPVPTDPKKPQGRVPTGKMVGRDWVEYSPLGGVQRTVIKRWIQEINCPQPLTGRGGENPAVVMANMIWDAIRPRYEAWKAGQEMPVDGTPLAAWNGVSRQQAEVLKSHGVLTVEALSALTDTHMQTLGIMGLRNLVEGAKRFIVANDKGAVSNALKEKDEQIDALKSQMEEMRELLEAVRVNTGVAAPEPKRRGRPPKAAQPEMAA